MFGGKNADHNDQAHAAVKYCHWPATLTG